MTITNKGVLLNGIKDVQKSVVYTGSYAILDNDDVWIQIPESELKKLLNKYIKLKKDLASTNIAGV